MSTKAPQSLCILRLSAIGDVCNAVAAVQAIQARHPSCSITWIIGKVEHQLLKGLPNVEFIVFDKSAGKAARKTLKRTLKSRQFDALLLMQVAMRANLLSRYVKAKRRIGFDWKRSKELHSLFINERIQERPHAHVLEGFYDFAFALGVSPKALKQPAWNIPLEASDIAFAKDHINDDQMCLVICPSASKAERNWLPERYAALADYAVSKGYKVLLCGGPSDDEKALGEAIQALSQQRLTNLIGASSLKGLLAILKRATLVLAPDTGPAHMAVSQGTPVIGLYGHSNPSRTGPYLSLKHVVEVYHEELLVQTGKQTSELPWGTRVKGEHVMEKISVERVMTEFDRVSAELGDA